MVGSSRHGFTRLIVLLVLYAAGLMIALAYPFTARSQEATPEPLPELRVDPEWDGTYRRIRVPILMYHYISTPPADADETRVSLSVSPELFRAHLEYLFYQGFTTISLYDLHESLLTGTPLPPKPVILTFDDGYVDHYTNALPALQEFGFQGTFFVITGTADSGNPNHLSWEQVNAMAAAGMHMESHTKDHPDLRGRDNEFLVYQLLGSFESLRAYTGSESRMFCYPVGYYDRNVIEVLQSLNVMRAVTTQPGDLHTNDNRLELTRLRVSNTTTVQALASMLDG